MKVELWYSGAETSAHLQKEIEVFQKRLKKYLPFATQLIHTAKTKNPEQRMEKEKDQVRKHLKPGDYLVLLDEHGKEFTSKTFADHLQHLFNQGRQRLIFLAGSSHGFHEELQSKADEKVALSQMTFNHEHTRLIFTEQLYRCMTIIHNEPYHH